MVAAVTNQEKAALIGFTVLESAERVHEANKWLGNQSAFVTHPFTIGDRHYEIIVREASHDQ